MVGEGQVLFWLGLQPSALWQGWPWRSNQFYLVWRESKVMMQSRQDRDKRRSRANSLRRIRSCWLVREDLTRRNPLEEGKRWRRRPSPLSSPCPSSPSWQPTRLQSWDTTQSTRSCQLWVPSKKVNIHFTKYIFWVKTQISNCFSSARRRA